MYEYEEDLNHAIMLSLQDDNDEYQLALLESYSQKYHQSTKQINIKNELDNLRMEMTNSSKSSKCKNASETITQYNILSLTNQGIIIDTLPNIFKYLPLTIIMKVRTICKTFNSAIDFTKLETIYVDINTINKIFSLYNNSVVTIIYNNVKMIYLIFPRFYDNKYEHFSVQVEKILHKKYIMTYYEKPILPPKIKKLFIEIYDIGQLNILHTNCYKYLNITITCCSGKQNCKLCQFNLITEFLETKKIKCELVHNNKIARYLY